MESLSGVRAFHTLDPRIESLSDPPVVKARRVIVHMLKADQHSRRPLQLGFGNILVFPIFGVFARCQPLRYWSDVQMAIRSIPYYHQRAGVVPRPFQNQCVLKESDALLDFQTNVFARSGIRAFFLRSNHQGAFLEAIRLNRPKPPFPSVIQLNGSGGITNSQSREQPICARYVEARTS